MQKDNSYASSSYLLFNGGGLDFLNVYFFEYQCAMQIGAKTDSVAVAELTRTKWDLFNVMSLIVEFCAPQ